MAEALSQSQIDELLRAMNNPAPPEEEAAVEVAPSAGKKYRKYDFQNPKKFTKDRLKILNNVYENFARLLNSHMTSLLRMACELELVSVEETRYIEFNNALDEKDLLAMFNISVEGEKYDGDPVMLQITSSTLRCMLDRLMGGEGDPDDYGADGYTDIEVGVFENIIKRYCAPLGDVWQNYIGLEYEYFKSETNPRVVQVSTIDDTVIIIVFNYKIQDVEGRINICMPGPLLEKIFKIFELPQISKAKDANKHNANIIMESIRRSVVEVKATLGEASILLSDLNALNVGDIINLNKHKDSDVTLYVGNNPWYRGQLGSLKQNVAVKIADSVPRDAHK